jgi:hypothetical protein
MPRPRVFPNYLSTIGIDLNDIEWKSPRVSVKERRKLNLRAYAQGKIIADDWLEAARKRLAAIGDKIAKDELDQRRRDEQVERSRDFEESVALAEMMTDAALPAIQKAYNAECKKLRLEIKRDQEKIRRAAQRIAKVKLARFRARR